ncbi:MAG: hypothetical protein AAFY70_18685, partial [Bacteroidota bacterium]
MRLSFLFLLLALAGFQLPAQITQEGMARRINSDKEPMPGVSVRFKDAGSKTSGQDGRFTLTFQNKKEGALIFMEEIVKAGFELVNEKDFDIMRITNTGKLGVNIIMAEAGYVNAAKQQYYNVSDSALRASFALEKRKILRKLEKAELSDAETEAELKILQERFEIQKESLDKLSEQFARVNFDDVGDLYEEALKLFKDGYIDSCKRKLENAKLIDRAKKGIQERERIKKAKETI